MGGCGSNWGEFWLRSSQLLLVISMSLDLSVISSSMPLSFTVMPFKYVFFLFQTATYYNNGGINWQEHRRGGKKGTVVENTVSE